MNLKLAATLLLTAALVLSSAPSQAEDGSNAEGAANLIVKTLVLPFRLVTGGVTGTYGLVTDGVKGAYDMSADANERIVDAGTSPAQLLVWPFTAGAGFVKGGVTGFSERFGDGFSYWDRYAD